MIQITLTPPPFVYKAESTSIQWKYKMSDYDWLRVTMSDYEWLWVTMSDYEWEWFGKKWRVSLNMVALTFYSMEILMSDYEWNPPFFPGSLSLIVTHNHS